MKSYTAAALAGLISTVAAHGQLTSPPRRTPGTAMAAACGQQVYSNQASDAYGNIQGELQVASSQSDYDAAKCDIWLCKGYKFDDNKDNVQTYTAGQVVPFVFDIRAPHTGYANVSVVDTASNTVIGDPLVKWDVYASTSTTIPANETNFDVTIPSDLGDKCATAGDCVIQFYWYAPPGVDQTYESCVDFTVGGSGSSSSGSSSAAASSAVATSSAVASSAVASSAVASSAVASSSTAASSVAAVEVSSAAATSTHAAQTTARAAYTSANATASFVLPTGGAKAVSSPAAASDDVVTSTIYVDASACAAETDVASATGAASAADATSAVASSAAAVETEYATKTAIVTAGASATGAAASASADAVSLIPTSAIPSALLTSVLPTVAPTVTPTPSVSGNGTYHPSTPHGLKPLPEGTTLKDILDWINYILDSYILSGFKSESKSHNHKRAHPRQLKY